MATDPLVRKQAEARFARGGELLVTAVIVLAASDRGLGTDMALSAEGLMKRPNRGTTPVMLTLTLGLLVSAGIVMALVRDWVKHPDLIPIPITQRGREAPEGRRESTYHHRRR